ncbi:hypothetical protein RND81_12G060000 [Saponaria officinalis]|uniref:Reverse transcriptase n=1 Tax=Saponaria officinalis TaxID=3572 RepID=A0AAW1H6V1_SAPOF
MIIDMSKKVIFAMIKDGIWKKLQGWKEKFLSKIGKEVLIKVVIKSIPTYMMSIFRVPSEIITEIQSIIARFWWGAKGEERKLYWFGREHLCKPNSMGGMGFRNMKVFNEALLAKQVWRLLKPNYMLLFNSLKARYFKHTTVLEAAQGWNPSYTWRSSWRSKSLLLEGLKWRVGNRLNLHIWEDAWVPRPSSTLVPALRHDSDMDLRVVDLILNSPGRWNMDLLELTFEPGDVDTQMLNYIGGLIDWVFSRRRPRII